jgi:hypothetical protein
LVQDQAVDRWQHRIELPQQPKHNEFVEAERMVTWVVVVDTTFKSANQTLKGITKKLSQ